MACTISYPPDLIRKVIKLVDSGVSVSMAARMNNIPRQTVANWADRREAMNGMTGADYVPETTAKIVCFDIECSDIDILVSQYGLKNNTRYHKHHDIVRDWTIFSFAWKWLGEASKCVSVSSKDVFNDEAVVRQAYDILSQADIWVGHNVDRFDVKKLNARFAIYGLPKLPKKQTVDTLKLARKDYAFTSNSLSYLCQYLNVGVYKDSPPDWIKIKQGCPEALANMRHYNRVDCDATEALYLFLNPRQDTPPNLNLYDRKKDIAGKLMPCCKACGSPEITESGQRYYQKRVVPQYRCTKCFWVGTA